MVSKDASRFSILDNLFAMFPFIAASESSNLSIICKKIGGWWLHVAYFRGLLLPTIVYLTAVKQQH